MGKLKIAFIVGARPNYMKAFPLFFELKRFDVTPYIINTGQHFSVEMSEIFFKDFKVPPHYVRHLTTETGSQAVQTASILVEVEKELLRMRPDLVIVFGDVNSTLAGALAAKKLSLKILHVESGLRSWDWEMPEEVNRVLVDRIADYHFATSGDAVENLLKEGLNKDNVHFIGNTMIDSLVSQMSNIDRSDIIERLGLENGEFAVLTLHRASNTASVAELAILISKFQGLLSKKYLVWPIHPRTAEVIKRGGISIPEKLMIIDPIGYFDFIKLVKNACFVLTDSGGVQEESCFLGVPCITLRKNTERPVTVQAGGNTILPPPFDGINAIVDEIMSGSFKIRPPEKWDGFASRRGAQIIIEKIFGERYE